MASPSSRLQAAEQAQSRYQIEKVKRIQRARTQAGQYLEQRRRQMSAIAGYALNHHGAAQLAEHMQASAARQAEESPSPEPSHDDSGRLTKAGAERIFASARWERYPTPWDDRPKILYRV